MRPEGLRMQAMSPHRRLGRAVQAKDLIYLRKYLCNEKGRALRKPSLDPCRSFRQGVFPTPPRDDLLFDASLLCPPRRNLETTAR